MAISKTPADVARVVRKRIGTGERLRPRPHRQAYRQKFLNLSGASSVYLTVCWMFSSLLCLLDIFDFLLWYTCVG